MRSRGFTLVEVLVALVVVVMGMAALMIAVSSTARTSGILRDKTIAQWIALNRLAEIRLNLTKFGQNNDTGELDFGNRKWHYDTRYFDTNINSMKRVVVRVYPGDAKTKGNALIETVGFVGQQLAIPGNSNLVANWQKDSLPTATPTTPTTITPTTPTNPATGTPSPPGQQPIAQPVSPSNPTP
jgi:general secretion pathway protein I